MEMYLLRFLTDLLCYSTQELKGVTREKLWEMTGAKFFKV